MNKKHKSASLIILLFISLALNCAQGQDVYFSQHYANKPLINPALTGMRSCPTVTTSYKNQWPELNQAYVTYAVGYDQYFEGIHGGTGIYLLKDDMGGAAISTITARAMYAYRAQLSPQWNMHLSLAASYSDRNYNTGQMIFPDMVNSGAGTSVDNPATLNNKDMAYVDFAGGLLFFSEAFYGGVSAFHLNQKFQLVREAAHYPVPMRFTTQIGANIGLGPGDEPQATLSPSAIAHVQEKFSRISAGLYFNWRILTVGAWYHQTLTFRPQFFTVMAGFVYKNMQIAYSNDFLLAGTTNKIMPSHEISLTLNFRCIKKKKKWEAISCPDF